MTTRRTFAVHNGPDGVTVEIVVTIGDREEFRHTLLIPRGNLVLLTTEEPK